MCVCVCGGGLIAVFANKSFGSVFPVRMKNCPEKKKKKNCALNYVNTHSHLQTDQLDVSESGHLTIM